MSEMSEVSLTNRLALAFRFARRALGDSRGVSAVEYAVIAGSLSIVIIAVVTQIGSNVVLLYQSVLDLF